MPKPVRYWDLPRDERPKMEPNEMQHLGLTASEREAARRYLEHRRRMQTWEPIYRSWMD